MFLIYRFLLFFVIIILNLILLLLFEFLFIFEDWSLKFELFLNFLRCIFVKLLFIVMFMILLYKNINDCIQDRGGLFFYCKQCWENEIVVQMYMFVWVDFFVVVFVIFGFEIVRKFFFKYCYCFRKIGMIQFDILCNVIDFVYG